MSTVGTSARISRTVAARSGQITITTRDPPTIARSSQPSADDNHGSSRSYPKFDHLLRQARVHVVQMRQAQQPGEGHADAAALLVRVNRIVPPGQRQPQDGERQQEVQRHLGPRRADAARGSAPGDAGTGRCAGPASRHRARTDRSRGRPCARTMSGRGCDGTRRTEYPGARRTAPARSSECACAAVRRTGRSHGRYMVHYAADRTVLRSETRDTTGVAIDSPLQPTGTHLAPQDRRQRGAAVSAAVARGYGPPLACRARSLAAVARRRPRPLSHDDSRSARGAGASCSRPSTSTCPTCRWPTRSSWRRSSTTSCRRTSAATSIRIRDTIRAAGSTTLAATVVLLDRGVGLLGLVFVAATGATVAAGRSETLGPVGPGLLWLILAGALAVAGADGDDADAGRPAAPAARAAPPGVGPRAHRTAHDGAGPIPRGAAGPRPGLRQLPSSSRASSSPSTLPSPTPCRSPFPLAHLAMLVPLSSLMQMLPVSVNGFGVREATFSFYFAQLRPAARVGARAVVHRRGDDRCCSRHPGPWPTWSGAPTTISLTPSHQPPVS